MKDILLLLVFGLTLSCRETGSNENELFQRVTPLKEGQRVTYEMFNESIIKPYRCLDCHGGDDWAKSRTGLLEVLTPGEPFSSDLYTEVENGSMPPGGPSVDKARLELLEQFIRDY